MSLLRKRIMALKESWVRRRGQILERILHNTRSAFVFELGVAVLVLGGADRARLLKRIEPFVIKNHPICF